MVKYNKKLQQQSRWPWKCERLKNDIIEERGVVDRKTLLKKEEWLVVKELLSKEKQTMYEGRCKEMDGQRETRQTRQKGWREKGGQMKTRRWRGSKEEEVGEE